MEDILLTPNLDDSTCTDSASHQKWRAGCVAAATLKRSGGCKGKVLNWKYQDSFAAERAGDWGG